MGNIKMKVGQTRRVESRDHSLRDDYWEVIIIAELAAKDEVIFVGFKYNIPPKELKDSGAAGAIILFDKKGNQIDCPENNKFYVCSSGEYRSKTKHYKLIPAKFIGGGE